MSSDKSERVFGKAKGIVERLEEAGHEAYFAGGCVRDHLLGQAPKDIDIATSARPEEVQRLFRRTIGVGKQFGVIIVVLGEDQFDVATFRADGAYDDGRHPDRVVFTNAVEDVRRRDFTVNGLLMAPAGGRVIDHVGGVADLEAGVIRAIGDPAQRFAEDHLRILRAVRFAARLGFTIEAATRGAITRLTDRAASPSAERVRGELDRMLAERAPGRALRLLRELGLLEPVLPEVAARETLAVEPRLVPPESVGSSSLDRAQLLLDGLAPDELEVEIGWAVLLEDAGAATPRGSAARAGAVLQRLRASNSIVEAVTELVLHRDRLLFARRVSRARRALVCAHPRFDLLVRFGRVEARVVDARERVGERLALAPAPLPAPLLNGTELMQMGAARGRGLGRLLRQVRFRQLDGALDSAASAAAWLRRCRPDSFPVRDDEGA